MSGFVLLADMSSEEEEVKEVTKEEHEIDVAHSWMEVGGSPHWWMRRCRGCYMRYSSLLEIA